MLQEDEHEQSTSADEGEAMAMVPSSISLPLPGAAAALMPPSILLPSVYRATPSAGPQHAPAVASAATQAQAASMTGAPAQQLPASTLQGMQRAAAGLQAGGQPVGMPAAQGPQQGQPASPSLVPAELQGEGQAAADLVPAAQQRQPLPQAPISGHADVAAARVDRAQGTSGMEANAPIGGGLLASFSYASLQATPVRAQAR